MRAKGIIYPLLLGIGGANWCILYRNPYKCFSKIKRKLELDLSHDSSIAQLDIYPKHSIF